MSEALEWDGAALRELSAEWAARVVFYERCASTNDEARRLSLKGRADGMVVLAERQEAGRGRRGQAWHCPPGEGIAMTYLYRPDFPRKEWARIALATGLAVAEGLEAFGVRAEVKWPNDVWIDGRKIAGILVEAEGEGVFIGIGINVNVAAFPADLLDPATSLFLETGARVAREEVLVRVLEALERRLSQVARDFDFIRRGLAERCVLSGRVVELDRAGRRERGWVRGFGPSGELLFQAEGREEVEAILQAERVRALD